MIIDFITLLFKVKETIYPHHKIILLPVVNYNGLQKKMLRTEKDGLSKNVLSIAQYLLRVYFELSVAKSKKIIGSISLWGLGSCWGNQSNNT
jgi:hypothetical protein